MDENKSKIRIKLTAIVGFFLAVFSTLMIVWVIGLLPIYSDEPQRVDFNIWQDCKVPFKIHVGIYVNYGDPDQPKAPKKESLVTFNVSPLEKGQSQDIFSQHKCTFEFYSKNEILNFKISQLGGNDTQDAKYLEYRGRYEGAPEEYVVSPDPEQFSGSVWFVLEDISGQISFTDRKIATSWSMFNKANYDSLDPKLLRSFQTSIILPQNHNAASYSPFSLQLKADGHFTSIEEKKAGNLTYTYQPKMVYNNPNILSLSQVLLIAASTLFGAGISAMLEAFLAGGVLNLHKNTIKRIIDEASNTENLLSDSDAEKKAITDEESDVKSSSAETVSASGMNASPESSEDKHRDV